MEAVVRRSVRRGRKRRKNDVENVEVDRDGKKRAVTLRSKAFLGRYVRKEFKDKGIYLGKIIFYDTGMYKVVYEDGDCEDLDSSEVKAVLFEDDEFNDQWLDRKKKLDKLIAGREVKIINSRVKYAAEPVNDVINKFEVPVSSDLDNGDSDLVSDVSEDYVEEDLSSEVELSLFPAPQLPPSSNNNGIPEEYVSYLLSVYSFLRSFSIRLFLSPFGLDDFVGALNCSAPNTLLDSIHVALMRALRRHLRKLSSDGSELASKCLRNIDWSLLDTMTWPVYLVHYLTVMGYTNEPGWSAFYTHTLQREYYLLSAGRKLMVLQILCDDVLDSEELKAEIDMREESEVGTESDISTGLVSLSAPRIVHPRCAKTSACKDQEAMELCNKNHERKKPRCADNLGSKVSAHNSLYDVNQQSNSDECRLCGMDGILLCCDGCPSSYHARCIGVSKMYIPEGAWYCPECRISEIEPKIMRGTTLKGAEVFGVDSYGQLFLGTCSHLLVLKALAGSDSIFRYYNEKDIPAVLRALNANVQHSTLYLEICKGIMQYWKIPVCVLLPNGELSEIDSEIPNRTKYGSCSTLLLNSLVKGSSERENTGSCVTEFSSEDASSSNFSKEPMLNETVGSVFQTDGIHYQVNGDSMTRQRKAPIDLQPSEQVGLKNIISAGSVGQQVLPSECTQQNNTKLVEIATFTPRSSNSYFAQVNSNCAGVAVSFECEKACGRPSAAGYRNPTGCCLYLGSSFRPQRYINSYLHGDFAASAAARLAEISSDNSQGAESHASDKRQKLSASALLQTKAFSSAATRFFWPNAEKKIVEVPRERCSWCLSCKAAMTSKKGCLLNAAASNAIKGAVNILTGLRPARKGEGNLRGIATYIMLMEESLTGLAVGPFLSTHFREQWRKQAEQATSCTVIKSLLLKFEENIRFVAFSEDWFRLVDGVVSESSISHSATGAAESTHKRKPGRRGRKPLSMVKVTADDCQDEMIKPGRRGRKPLSMVKVTAEDCQDKRMGFTWQRGGMLPKRIFQRATLPRSMLKKEARHGGLRKIPGIYYTEWSETAKRSRQLVWRAAVDVCKTISQLALQVRYLDMHVRWSDLARPEQILQDGKGPDTEATVFRNASICHKRIVGEEVRYNVAFRNQKHLPSRLMKNIIEVEQSQEGEEKYWFSESRVPLYLIKEYEENMGKDLPLANKLTDAIPKLQKRSLGASRNDIFSYLARKRDGDDKHCCASCQVDVLFRNAVRCNTCQGLCHKQCAFSSTVVANDEVEFMTSCKQCYQNRSLTRAESSRESPTSPLHMQGQDYLIPISARKGGKVGSYNPSASTVTLKHSSKMKHASSSNLATKTKPHWGVIWRKKNEDTGGNFRSKHILLKDNPDRDLLRPSCHLCHKPYDPYLMYIRCETCMKWFHSEAVELEESKISEVLGFKCCRCRRARIPICPYLDLKSKRQLEGKRMRARALKMDSRGMEPDSGLVSELQRGEDMTNPLVPLEGTSSLENEIDLDSSSELSAALGGNMTICTEEMPALVERGKLPVRKYAGLGKDSDTPFLAKYKPATSTASAAIAVPCKMCSRTEPLPDLCCQTCDMWIHRCCSPWIEDSCGEDDWKCGNCRDWR